MKKKEGDEMSDAEIIKALECCDDGTCKDCPIVDDDCIHKIRRKSIDLINRQKAEIERLQIEAERLEVRIRDLTNYQTEDAEMRKRARVRAITEAIKQFARYLIGRSDKKGRIHVSDLPDYVSDFLSAYTGKVIQEMEGEPSKIEHDSLCETETYKSY